MTTIAVATGIALLLHFLMKWLRRSTGQESSSDGSAYDGSHTVGWFGGAGSTFDGSGSSTDAGGGGGDGGGGSD